jgi:hypothetical protein
MKNFLVIIMIVVAMGFMISIMFDKYEQATVLDNKTKNLSTKSNN